MACCVQRINEVVADNKGSSEAENIAWSQLTVPLAVHNLWKLTITLKNILQRIRPMWGI